MNDTHSASRFELILSTPFYISGYGTMLGMAIGTLVGTMVVPLAGTIVGGVVGAVFGTLMFAILGLGQAALLYLMGLDGVARSQNWLRILAGGVVSVSFFLLEYMPLKDVFSTVGTYVIFSLVIGAIALIPGISAAYATDAWQEWLREKSPRKLKQRPHNERLQLKWSDVSDTLYDGLNSRIRWLVYLTPFVAVFITVVHAQSHPVPLVDLIGWPFAASLAFVVYLLFQLSFIASWMTLIIRVANRYLFTADIDPRIYKRNLSILTFCLVLPSQLVMAAVIGAPIAAIIATLAVRDYADWVHSPEKAKRLQKSGKKRDSQPTASLEMPILEAEASTQQATQ
ncbi:MAG: hypothetical protein CL607_08325 [Anaerolineaceae bacterium]|nr:hypothetical protein [Anaerolineaceae bacterium]